MAIRKRYYARRSGRKSARYSKRIGRSSKYSSGNRRSGGLYRLASRGRRRRNVGRPELKYLNSCFTNDNCCQFTGGVALNGPGENAAFNGDENTWYQAIGCVNVADFNANTCTGVCRPSQGSGASQRIGRKVCLKSLQMRWRLTEGRIADEVGDDGVNKRIGCGARIVVFLDTQANGTIGAASEFFDQQIAQFTASQLHFGGINAVQHNQSIENSQRFKILMDKVIMIPPSGSVAQYDNNDPQTVVGASFASKERLWNKWLRLPNVEIEMAGSTSNPNNCKSNAVHVIVKPIGGNVYISGNFRTRFTDV